jgi:hypothetical protein
MDGASRAFAAPLTYTINGAEYPLKGRLARFFGEMEAHILQRRPNPLQVYRESAGLFDNQPDLKADLLERAKVEAFRARSVTRVELNEWMNSFDGAVFCLWLSIRDADPELLTRAFVEAHVVKKADEEARRLLASGCEPVESATKSVMDTVAEIQDLINRAGGEDELGNSTGPSLGTTTTGRNSTDQESQSIESTRGAE